MKPKPPWYEQIRRQVPLVHRRTLEEALGRHEQLLQVLAGGVPLPTHTPARWLKEPQQTLNAVVCLVAAHAHGRRLPASVSWLLQQHLSLGHRVVLVLGVRDPDRALPELPEELLQRLSGVLLRSELGGDLGAWAHVHALLKPRLDPRRLALINDRWLGPLDEDDFDALWARADASTADVIGYTEAPETDDSPRHLRRDGLIFGREAWLGGHLSRLLEDVLAFDDPVWQHEIYETRWTRRLKHAGLRCEALFKADARVRNTAADDAAPPAVADAGPSTDMSPSATADANAAEWSRLLGLGFPFIHRQALRESPEAIRRHPLVKAAPVDLRGALRTALGAGSGGSGGATVGKPAARRSGDVPTVPSPASERR